MTIWDILLQQIINGLSLGAMYALLALGFTMVYGIIELINFRPFQCVHGGLVRGLWVLQAIGHRRTGPPALRGWRWSACCSPPWSSPC